jgi:branched-chain amino acid transport system permease protein
MDWFKNKKLWLVAIFLLLAVLVPFFASQYHAYLMLSFFAYGVVLLGLNLLFGYTGLVSFGHALFVGIGAYTAAFFTYKFSILSMELIIVTAIIIAAVVAALIGMICIRYVKIYFAMLTLAFGMLFYSFLLKTYYVTGGDEGMRVLRPALLGFGLSEVPHMEFLTRIYYYYALAILVIATLIMRRIVSSHFGLCIKAVRDNPEKAEFLGIGVKRYRWYSFVISAIYAATGGALLAPVIGQVDPGLAYWTHSGDLVFMILLGGFANFFGPMVGGFVFIYLRDTVMSIIPYWRIIFGAILAFIVIAAPGGLMGIGGLFHRWSHLWTQLKPTSERKAV